MLEKARASAVFIITTVSGIVTWEDFIPNLREVNLDPVIRVSSTAFGSGFFVSSDGYIITNRHVVNDFQSELERVLPLLKEFVGTYFEARKKATGQDPAQQEVQELYNSVLKVFPRPRYSQILLILFLFPWSGKCSILTRPPRE